MSVRPHGTTPLPLDGFSWNLILDYFFENLSKKFRVHYSFTRITLTLHKDKYIFLIISRSVLLRMRNVSDKSCTENQNTHFMFGNCFSKIVPFMRKCGKNIVKPDTSQMTIWRMRISCLIPKATNTHTHSEYVTLDVFPLQQKWHERTSLLRNTYIGLLFNLNSYLTENTTL